MVIQALAVRGSADCRLTRRVLLLGLARAGLAATVPVALTGCDGGNVTRDSRRQIAEAGGTEGGLLAIDSAGSILLVTDGVGLAWRT